jgi:chaperonin GroEL
MYREGIIDPAKVTKNALRNAVSAAGTLLTTNFAIIEESGKTPN